ncbi:hypothetical protein [Streptomyces sp. NPDC017529]|uniref:hypothetical protein n=1 Tax=Streptomyces sp. NPDC017529 TaxID=3365000 RepID=UPI0037921DC4
MGRRKARARGVGGFGALICVLLALLCAVWIAHDLLVARRPLDVWWLWAGEPVRAAGSAVWATTLLDPVLGLACLLAAVAVLRRSPAAPCALTAVALATVLFRAPQLGSLTTDTLSGLEPGLKEWALVTSGVGLVASVLLLIAASAGRGGADQRPGRLRFVPATLAALLLGASGLALAGWQAYWLRELGRAPYWDSVIGDAGAFRSLLQPPENWYLLSLALLALVAAAGLAGRRASARPLGMLAAALLLAHGLAALAAGQHAGLLGRFHALATRSQLDTVTVAFAAVAGLVALLALALAGGRNGPRGPADGPGRPDYAPPPPSDLPPGW